MTQPTEYGLGRIPTADARDGDFGIRRVQGASARVGTKVWTYDYDSLDQNGYGICVGAAWEHWLLCEPTVRKQPGENPNMMAIYLRCTQIDEWTNNDNGDVYFGTSTRSGAKVMQEYGFLGSYLHAKSLEEAGDWLLDQGPLVVGANWYTGMFGPFDGPFIKVTGDLVGGHAFLLQSVNWDERYVMIRNSWGNVWGPWQNGLALIRFDDLERLLFREGGDCIAGTEILLSPPEPKPEPSKLELGATELIGSGQDYEIRTKIRIV